MLDFARFQVISFDCYGTLIDWESGIRSALRPILSSHKAELSDSEILQLYGELEAEAESSEYVLYREVLRRVLIGFGERLGFQVGPQEENVLAESLGQWLPFPDTVTALRRLKTKYQLAIISNIDDDLLSATAPRLQIAFDHVITAGQARAYKPSLTIFALAEQRMQVPREHWLHAGQSIYHDVIPAKSLDIANVWVNRPSQRSGSGAAKPASGVPDLEVASLQALADLAV
jgi:2-haloacid dehalogenase